MDLGVQFFTAAKAQHESGAKWSLVVLVLLVYFHLAIAGPYAQQTADKAEVDRALDANRKVEAQLDPIVKSAAAFVVRIDDELTTVSTRLRDDLVAHFGALDAAIRQLSSLTPGDAEGQPGGQVFTSLEDPRFAQQQQQQQQQAPPLEDMTPRLAPMPPDLRRLVATAAQTGDANQQYVEEIERYIAASVITPAFARANALWAERHLPGLADNAATLNAEVERGIAAGGSAAEQLKQLRTAVASLLGEAQRLSFAPPSDAGWWRSVAGKEESIRAMVDAMKRGAENIGVQQEKLQAAKDEVSKSVQANLERAEQIDDALAELEKQARDLQAQLGEIGEPLKVISVRLSLLAPLLPLVIALAIAALTLWRAEALRRMRFAAGLVPSGAEGDVLRRWLREAAGGSARLLAAREVAIAGIALAWMLAAWREVRALPAPQLSDLEIIDLAMAALIGARAHHWHQCALALRFAGGR